MSTQLSLDPGNFYVWRASDQFAIHLSLNVVTQLTSQISRAGNEAAGMTGILIGRNIETPVRATVIEDFKLLIAEQPSRSGSESDERADSTDALLEMACRLADTGSEQRSVGFFRIDREGRLNMRARDLDTFSRLFCETGKVALLIQTSRRGNESDAALFYWQQGGAYPRDFGFGFPLDAGQLAEGHPGWRYPDPLDNANSEAEAAPRPQPKPQAAAPIPPPPPRPVPLMQSGIRWSHLLPTAAIVVVGICAVQKASNTNHLVSAAPAVSAAPSVSAEPAVAAAPIITAAPSQASLAPPSLSQPVLGLSVVSRPHQMEIRWNRESEAIQASEHGVMKITEAGVTQAIPFDQRQLKDGYVAYTPTTTDVRITMDVTGHDGVTKTEGIRAVAIP